MNIHSYHGMGSHFENVHPWMNFFTSQGSFLWSFITIRWSISFEHSWLQWEWWPFWKFSPMNELLHIPRTIPVKSHFIQIKYILCTFMVTMGMVDISEMFDPEWTSSHPKDHSCEVSLQSDKAYPLNIHGYPGNGGYFETF